MIYIPCIAIGCRLLPYQENPSNMKSNMAGSDRFIRISIAAIVTKIVLSGTTPDIWGIVLLLLAVFFLVTGLLGTCPIYSYLGVKTGGNKPSTN